MFPRKSLALMVAGVVIAACGAVSPALANASATPLTVFEDCLDPTVLLPGVELRVRRRVPARFELVRDPSGRPLLFAFTSRCERYTAGGTTKPTLAAYFAAIIESPDGAGCFSRWPVVGGVKPDLVPLCNLYFLSGAWDNRAVARTYRAHLPNTTLRYVRDLSFEAGDLDLTRAGTPLRFRAGRAAPSPFELDAVLREQPLGGPATFTFYTGSGTVAARLEADDFALGQMDATLRLAPGSEMAYLVGTETPTPIAGFIARYPRGEARLLPREDSDSTTRRCAGRRATIVGSGRINGTADDDVIVGSRGRDVITGRGGDDRICAGRGRDRVRGGSGNDRVVAAGGGNDVVNCGRGFDRARADYRDRLKGCERARPG